MRLSESAPLPENYVRRVRKRAQRDLRGHGEGGWTGGAEVSPERTFAPSARRSARGASGALLIAEGARRSSPTPSTRDRILGVRGGPGAPPGNVRRRHRNANAN